MILLSLTILLTSTSCSRKQEQKAQVSADDIHSGAFKFTITTDALNPRDNGEKREKSEGDDTVSILIQIYDPDSKYSINGYDLDCEGDGEYEYIGLTESKECIYERNSGNHQIWIRGEIPAIWLCKQDEEGIHRLRGIIIDNPDAILSIDDWGNIQWKSMASFAQDCINLKTIPNSAPNLTNVKDMSFMFNNAKLFNQPIDHWDVSNVTNMSDMFSGASSFNQPLDKWNVSNVTNMSNIFRGASLFNQPLDKWNVSNVTNMSNMFNGASLFNQPLDKWNVSNVTQMIGMFSDATSFNQPLDKWDVSNVTNMRSMFSNAISFNQPLDKWDVSYVINMSYMFHNAQSFDYYPENWVIPENKSIESRSIDMFSGTKIENLAQTKPLKTEDRSETQVWFKKAQKAIESAQSTTNVKENDTKPFKYTINTDIDVAQKQVVILVTVYSLNNEFPVKYDLDCDSDGVYEYIGLTRNHYCIYEPNSGTHQISVRGDIPAMHLCPTNTKEKCIIDCRLTDYDNSAESLVSIDSWGDIQWKSMSQFAKNCSNLTAIPSDAPILTHVKDMSHMFENAICFNTSVHNWDVSNVTNMDSMFKNATSFNQPLDNWNVSSVTHMISMFENATSFNQPLNNWNVSNVISMIGMFDDAKSFNQPLNNWNVSNVINMSWMFYGAESFNQPLDKWDVSNVALMDFMFDGAKSFNQPLDKWDVSNVVGMIQMFSKAKNFNQPVDNWNVSNVINMSGMFDGAELFNQPLNNWDVSNVTNMDSMFNQAYSFNQPLNNWKVSNVTNMRSMFSKAASFNQPLDNWDVSNVTDMESMFYDAISFNQPLNNWDVSNVTNMTTMFHNASSFSYYPDSWNIPKEKTSSIFKYTPVEDLAK